MTKRYPSFLRQLILIPPAAGIIYIILFTNYAPDSYVFVKYAFEHNTTREIAIASVTSNDFIFDALSVVGDLLRFRSATEYLLLIALLTALIFTLKYAYLIKKGRYSDVLVVYLASFFIDVNQFRFNLALIFLFLYWRTKTKIRRLLPLHHALPIKIAHAVSKGISSQPPSQPCSSRLATRARIFHFGSRGLRQLIPEIGFLALSFVSHVIPVAILVVRRLYYTPIIILVLISLFFANSVAAIGGNLDTSARLLGYINRVEFTFAKSLLFSLPSLYCFFRARRPKNKLANEITKFGKALVIMGFLFLIINAEVGARFFEIAFILCCVVNVFARYNLLCRCVLYAFAVGGLLSRSLHGINSASNFIDEYKLDPQIVYNLFFDHSSSHEGD